MGEPGEMRPMVGIGLFRGDDLVDDLVAGVGLAQAHRGAEAHLVAGNLVEVGDGERGGAPVELADARLEELLPLLGRLVLGVLAQVAVLARLQDLLGKEDLELVVELLASLLRGASGFPGPRLESLDL